MEKQATLKIGWAIGDITPYERTVSLYGQGNMRITDEIRDPLLATALALEGDGGQMFMISCDLTYIPAVLLAGVRRELVGLDGYDPANLILNAIHTHTAPYLERERPSELWGELFNFSSQFVGAIMTPEEYLALVQRQIVDAARRAWQFRRPGGIAFELAYPAVNFSRRTLYQDGTCTMYGQTNRADFMGMEEASDPGMELMFTFDLDQKLTGIVANLSCPAQVIELSLGVSADYLGEVRNLLQPDYPAPLLLQIAPAGDQAPRDLLRQKWQKSKPYFPRDHRDDAHLKVVAERVAAAIRSRIAAAAADIEWAPVLAASRRLVDLPLYQVTRKQYDESRPVAEALEASYHANGDHFRAGEHSPYMLNRGIALRYHHQQKTAVVPVEIVALRVGDAAFISNPFELYTVYGQRIKAINPATQTFAVQLANGCSGYLPSARAVATGSYGCLPSSCWVGPEGGEMLVRESVSQLEALFTRSGKA